MKLNKNISIDFKRFNPNEQFRFHQGDKNSWDLIISCYDDGSPLSISGVAPHFNASLGGAIKEQNNTSAISISNGKIVITVTENMTDGFGKLEIEVFLITSDANLYTQTIVGYVEESCINETTHVTPSGNTWNDAIDELEQAIQNEASARASADSDLSDAIGEISSDLGTETTARENADNSLADDISDLEEVVNAKASMEDVEEYANIINGSINIGDNQIAYTSDMNGKLSTSKVKNANSTTAGDVYDVRYVNAQLGNKENHIANIGSESQIGSLAMNNYFVFQSSKLYQKTTDNSSLASQTLIATKVTNDEKSTWNGKNKIIFYANDNPNSFKPSVITSANVGDTVIFTSQGQTSSRVIKSINTTTDSFEYISQELADNKVNEITGWSNYKYTTENAVRSYMNGFHTSLPPKDTVSTKYAEGMQWLYKSGSNCRLFVCINRTGSESEGYEHTWKEIPLSDY